MELYQSGDGYLYADLYGKWFKVISVFSGDNRVHDSNKYMETNTNVGVLLVTDCCVVLADKDDTGVTQV